MKFLLLIIVIATVLACGDESTQEAQSEPQEQQSEPHQSADLAPDTHHCQNSNDNGTEYRQLPPVLPNIPGLED